MIRAYETCAMTSNYKLTIDIRLFGLVIGLFLLAGGDPCRAQTNPPQRSICVIGTSGLNLSSSPALSLTDQPPACETEAEAPSAAPAGTATADSDWHFVVAPYLWFPGVHGTVGAGSHDASVHASPGDVLSHFRFGLMGAVEGRYKRLVLPLDIMWVRLGDDKALPGPNLEAASIKSSTSSKPRLPP